MKQNYFEWRADFRSGWEDHQTITSLKFMRCEASLLQLFDKYFPNSHKNIDRPYQAFKDFEVLISETLHEFVGDSGPSIWESLFNKVPNDFKIDPQDKRFKNFLEKASKIAPPSPCETQLTLYISKNNDALGVALPTNGQREFLYNELTVRDNIFPSTEIKLLESDSPDIFRKGNTNHQVIAKYYNNPKSLFITGYRQGNKINVFCRTLSKRETIIEYLGLKLAQDALFSQPVIGFSLMVCLFSKDSNNQINYKRFNTDGLCIKETHYHGLFVKFLPKAVAEIAVEYAHDCTLS